MRDDLTIVEILGLGVRSEEEAAELYGGIARLIKNELVRAKYESLAREEIGHRHMLVGMHRKMTGEDAPPKIPGKPKTAEGERPAMAVEAIEDLLKYAISREREAHDFYRKAATKASDTTSQRMLEYLADIERGHELLIESELDAFLRDRNWYADKPDVQLVGP